MKPIAGLPPETLLDPLAGVADLLDRLLDGGGRAAGLLGFVIDFVLLPAGDAGPVSASSFFSLPLPWSAPSLNDAGATLLGFTSSGTIPDVSP